MWISQVPILLLFPLLLLRLLLLIVLPQFWMFFSLCSAKCTPLQHPHLTYISAFLLHCRVIHLLKGFPCLLPYDLRIMMVSFCTRDLSMYLSLFMQTLLLFIKTARSLVIQERITPLSSSCGIFGSRRCFLIFLNIFTLVPCASFPKLVVMQSMENWPLPLCPWLLGRVSFAISSWTCLLQMARTLSLCLLIEWPRWLASSLVLNLPPLQISHSSLSLTLFSSMVFLIPSSLIGVLSSPPSSGPLSPQSWRLILANLLPFIHSQMNKLNLQIKPSKRTCESSPIINKTIGSTFFHLLSSLTTMLNMNLPRW